MNFKNLFIYFYTDFLSTLRVRQIVLSIFNLDNSLLNFKIHYNVGQIEGGVLKILDGFFYMSI